MTHRQQQQSSLLAAPSPSPRPIKRRGSKLSSAASVSSVPNSTKLVIHQHDTAESDLVAAQLPSPRQWNDPGTLLFLLVAGAYLIMAVWDFLKTTSPIMPTIILFYAGAYVRLNLLPFLPILKELFWQWMRQQQK